MRCCGSVGIMSEKEVNTTFLCILVLIIIGNKLEFSLEMDKIFYSDHLRQSSTRQMRMLRALSSVSVSRD